MPTSIPTPKITTKTVLTDRANRPDDLVASGYQLNMLFKPGQKALSLRSEKTWHMLVKFVGAEFALNKEHTIALADLTGAGFGNMTRDERVEALRELQTTLIEVRVPSPKIKGGFRIISETLLIKVERDEDDRGDVVFKFGETLRRLFANCVYWAILSKRVVMSFESRYSLRLYEIMAVRAHLNHKHSETFTLEDLRSRLGVPVGKLTTWHNLYARALEPAIAEVNQLADFTVRYEAVKKGRSVVAVKLFGEEKMERARARTAVPPALEAPRAERIARRKRGEGTTWIEDAAAVETIIAPEVPEFPANGIYYTPWEAIARANLPSPQRDFNAVANSFRSAAKRDGKPLRGNHVTAMFAAFCRSQKPAS